MALFGNVLKKGDFLCELYVDTCSDISDDCANEIMAVTVMPPQLVYVKSCVLDSSDNKTSDVWCKTDKTPISEHFIGTIVLKYSNQ